MKQRGLLVLSVLLLSGCGANSNQTGEGGAKLEPAPPIEAIDEPVPTAPPGFEIDIEVPPEVTSSSGYFCASNRHFGPCTSAELEEVRERAAGIEPLAGAEPRRKARLVLGSLDTLDLVVWPARNGRICLSAVELPGGGEPSGPFGPCLDACSQLCIDPVWMEPSRLAGVVSQRADVIEVELSRGTVRRYPLVGPVLPDTELRVFMVDLGTAIHRALRLFDGDELIAHNVRTEEELRWQECFMKLAEPGDDPEGEIGSSVDLCVERGESQPSE